MNTIGFTSRKPGSASRAGRFRERDACRRCAPRSSDFMPQNTMPTSPAASSSTLRGCGSITSISVISCSILSAIKSDHVALAQTAFLHAHENRDAHVRVEPRVEDQRLRRGASGSPRGGGTSSTMRSRSSRMPLPVFAEIGNTLVGVEADHVLDLLRGAIGVRSRAGRSCSTTGTIVEVRLEREVRVRERLRLDALRRVDHEDRALAGLQRARNLVREVDVPGRVDQVERVLDAVARGELHARGLRLDRDAALLLELHLVEELRLLLAIGQRAGHFEQAIGERALAVVDVRDDAEIAEELGVHRSRIELRATALERDSRDALGRRLRGESAATSCRRLHSPSHNLRGFRGRRRAPR